MIGGDCRAPPAVAVNVNVWYTPSDEPIRLKYDAPLEAAHVMLSFKTIKIFTGSSYVHWENC